MFVLDVISLPSGQKRVKYIQCLVEKILKRTGFNMLIVEKASSRVLDGFTIVIRASCGLQRTNWSLESQKAVLSSDKVEESSGH
jgi:hypothetical protein